ncbi:MAG: hypothetical protein C4320_02105, partial [Armatimonadota bacterium]
MLGRTNRRFPRVWLSLSVPHEGFAEGGPDALVNAARETGLPLDISRQPALWGGGLRKRASGETTLLSFGGRHLEVATDERHALDLTQAHLIETLSAIGRETLDIYVLKVRRALEEEVITGALAALEDARQEGHIRYFGIQAEGSGLATLGFWQFHDFSELLFVPNNPLQDQARSRLAGLAGERRVGLVGTAPLNWAHDLPAPVVAGALGLASEEAAARALLAAAEGTILVGVRTPRE